MYGKTRPKEDQDEQQCEHQKHENNLRIELSKSEHLLI
jgi:hypothetical protein